MTSLAVLEQKRPDLAATLKELTREELLENYAIEVLEKDNNEAVAKINLVDFGWLSARVKEYVQKMYGDDHSALITSEKSTILYNVENYQ